MSYSRLSLESEAAANNLPPAGPIRHHPNGLSTFSAPSSQNSHNQPNSIPIYANTNGGYRTANGTTVSVAVRPAYGMVNGTTQRFLANSNRNNQLNNHSNSSTTNLANGNSTTLEV